MMTNFLFFFLFTGYFRLGLRCRGLSVAVLFVSLLCRGWDRWLFIGAVRVLCGNGCHSSSLVHRHDQLPLSNRWWMFSRFTCLFITKLALPHACSVVTKLPPHHRLVVGDPSLFIIHHGKGGGGVCVGWGVTRTSDEGAGHTTERGSKLSLPWRKIHKYYLCKH